MDNRDSTQLTISSYDNVAKDYAGEFFDDDSDNHYIDKFLLLLPQGSKVLDAGCGPGNYSQYMKEKGFEVVGVDLSQGMLAIAQERVPGVTFLQQDLRNLHFEPNTFSGICAAYSLIHVPETDMFPVLRKLHTILLPQGALFLAMQEGEAREVKDSSFGSENILVHNCYTKEEITNLLARAGFKVVFTDVRPPHENEIPNNKLFVVARKV